MALHVHRETKCPSRYTPAEPVEVLVREDLCRLLNEPEAIRLGLERAQWPFWELWRNVGDNGVKRAASRGG